VTAREASEILSRPLVFGDENQIRAIKFMGELNEARAAVRACPRAPHKKPVTECSCTRKFSEDVRNQIYFDHRVGILE
jgi:hypothetical protein